MSFKKTGKHVGIIGTLLILIASLTTRLNSVAALSGLEPGRIQFHEVASGLTKPLFVTNAGDGSGRLFIVEKAGRILVLKNGSVLATPFLDIQSIVNSSGGEQGLLALAFHPNYASNGRFYTLYTNQNNALVLSQFTRSGSNPDQANPASRVQLLAIDHPINTNHNGGTLTFGPGGYLYWSTGDGGGAGDPNNNAQNLTSLLGKILRIDVNSASPYAIPPSNPFYNNPNPSVRKEIWAYGLRNPWRISFDRQTGDLFIADVGQSAREEINFQSSSSTGGENYGWRVMEGSLCYNPSSGCDQSGKVLPVAEYDHTLGCSVSGGYIYRGTNYPSLQGHYFYGDFCSGRLFDLYRNAQNAWVSTQLLDTAYSISSFGEGETGELYLVDYAGGKVYQIRYQETAVDVFIAGNLKGNYFVATHGVTKASYQNVQDGPVKVTSVDGTTPILASERFVYSFQSSKAYAEMIGYPDSQLATEYWFPWYNNISYSTQLRVSNMGAGSAEVKVYAGSDLVDTLTLNAGQTVPVSYNIDRGPLHVVSTDGTTKILASERFIQTYLGSASYSEMIGYPGSQLTTEYWFPWYNNQTYSTQLRVSNMGGNSAEVKVYAGSSTTPVDTFTLLDGEAKRLAYNLDNGPLHVVSTDGTTKILASERFILTYGASASYAEMMGYPKSQLTTQYCFPWYNNVTDGALALSSQLRVSNMGGGTAPMKVYLAGSQIDSFSLGAGQGRRVSYNFNSGPLCVVSTDGTTPILASERFISTYQSSASYSEMMGYPGNRLDDTYWFPWYNNVTYETELRIAKP